MIKRILMLFTVAAFAAPFVTAQVETGTAAGQVALDRARSGPISAGGPTTDVNVTISDGKSFGKDVVIIEEDEKWWSINASTGYDSLYMFRGVNVLGNGQGLYWLGGDIGITPWENGSFTAGVWYATGLGTTYNELDVFLDYTHSFGALDASFGWVLYYYPIGQDNQNELYWALAYNLEVGSVTITPNATYYLNVGDLVPGTSYLLLQIDASIPLYEDIVALEPWVGYGINFSYNVKEDGRSFDGGNNFELGLALPIQITDWFGVSGYVAYSYQWQDLAGTDENTWWAGASANFSF